MRHSMHHLKATAIAVLLSVLPLVGPVTEARDETSAAAAPAVVAGNLAGRWSGVALVQDAPVRLPSLVDFDIRQQQDGTLVVADRTRPGIAEVPISLNGRAFSFSLTVPVSPQRSATTEVTGTVAPDGQSLDVALSSTGLSGKVEDVRKATLTTDTAATAAFRHARVDAQGNAVMSYTYRLPDDVTGTYEAVTPEAAGLDRAGLEAMVNAILAEGPASRTESVLVLRGGKLVLAEYFWGNGPGDAHQTWSAVKSMTAVVAGIAWDQGAFKLDSTLLTYFPEHRDTLWGRDNLAVSVRQVLSMTSGATIPMPLDMTTSPDMVEFMLNQPLEHPPGMQYAYDNGLPVLAGQLIAQTTGQPFDRFAEENLFTPLGIDNVRWTYLADGSPNGAGGFFVTPHDMSRIGQMMLDQGTWRGKRIVSADWVQESTRQQTAKGDYPYGFYWHLNDEAHGRFQGAEGYLAIGALGQLIAVLPEDGIVFVVTSTNTKPLELLERFVIPAIKGGETVPVAPPGEPRESRPGVYVGYAPVLYDGWELSSLYVPVRDGTRLAVDVIRPTTNGVVVDEKLPVLWMHTPYNRRRKDGPSAAETYPSGPLELVRHGYVVAVADFRGLYASFGTNRLYNFGNYVEPAWTDAYDITEWLAQQPWSNGNIGMWGCSATGGSQQQAASTRPPSLKAIFALSPNYDNYEFINSGGVTTAVPYNLPSAATRDALASPVDGPDGADLLAEAVAGHIDDPLNQRVGLPFRDSRSPILGDWWQRTATYTYKDVIAESGIAVYSGGNWDESGTKAAPALMFGNMRRDRAKLILAPQGHCDWKEVAAENGLSIQTEQLRFFDYWLKGIENGVMDEPAVTYYTYNAPSGDEWRQSETWPLEDEQRTTFFFDNGGLAATTPTSPARNSLPMGEPGAANSISLQIGSPSLVYDSEPLEAATEVTGYPVVNLWIDSTASDADAVVQVLDVAPDGTTRSYQMIGRLRASHRVLGEALYENFGLPFHTHLEKDVRPLAPGVPAELEFALYPMSYVFPAGHRIRVAISFSNPAGDEGSVELLTGGANASSITLPIIADN